MLKNRISTSEASNIIKLAKQDCKDIKGYRFGQAIFNRLPDALADEIRGNEYDPFYMQGKYDVISMIYIYYTKSNKENI